MVTVSVKRLHTYVRALPEEERELSEEAKARLARARQIPLAKCLSHEEVKRRIRLLK